MNRGHGAPVRCRWAAGFLLSWVAAQPAAAQEPAAGLPAALARGPGLSWRDEASLGFPRNAHALASSDKALFVVGGTGSLPADPGQAAAVGPILEVERFDGSRWSVETELPGEGLNAPAAVFFEGRLWVLGGFGTTTNVPTAEVRVYDPGTGRWDSGPPLPAPRGGHAAVVFENRIHVLGGGNSVSTLADHCAFDARTRKWSARAPLSRPKGSPAAVVFAGRLWALGGRSGPEDFGDVECFDETAGVWTPGPAIPARGTCGAAVWGGTIWVLGGESQAESRTLDSVLCLDPSAKLWTEATPLPTARNYARAAVLGERLLVVGGSRSAGESHAGAGSTRVESARPLPAAK